MSANASERGFEAAPRAQRRRVCSCRNDAEESGKRAGEIACKGMDRDVVAAKLMML
jgi:hypothetical protein